MAPLSYCTGQWISERRHYYYPGYRKDYRFQTATRSISEELPLMAEIEQEERITVALERSKETGFLGVSQLHRLHKLYNFDVLRDLVFDAMHLVPLNLVKRRLDYLISNSLVDRDKLQEALTQMPWTTGISIIQLKFPTEGILYNYHGSNFIHLSQAPCMLLNSKLLFADTHTYKKITKIF